LPDYNSPNVRLSSYVDSFAEGRSIDLQILEQVGYTWTLSSGHTR